MPGLDVLMHNQTFLDGHRRREAADMNDSSRTRRSMTNAILTDSHFWVPVVVLVGGLLLLVLFGAGAL
jgi:hypothetical protein